MTTKIGWYGVRAVKPPIQAPVMPKPNNTSGKMQHEDAPIAPSTLPSATSFGRLSP